MKNHHTTKKGAYMSDREHTAKSTSHRTGLFATLSNLLNGQGTSAPSRTRTLLAVLSLTVLAAAITASPASAAPIGAKMETISGVSYTTAHVTGKISSPCSGFCGTTYNFEYATSESGPWNPGPGGFFPGLTTLDNQPVEGDFEGFGLKGATKYFVRLTVSTFFGGEALEAIDPAVPPNPSFTTLPVDPPTIPGTVEATNIFSRTAKVNGKVKRPANPANPGPGVDSAFDVKCHFEYITDDQYKANELASAPLYEGATLVDCAENPITKDTVDAEREEAVTADFAGLAPATTYHLRLVAENAAPGLVTKEAANFTTAAKVDTPTVVATDDASEVKFNSAEFSGKVLRPTGADPALDTNCHFEYITDDQYKANELALTPLFEGAVPADCEQNTIKGESETTVSAKATLVPTTTYHLRLVAENEGGSDARVATNTFTTPEAELPGVTIDPVEGGTFTTAHVSGTVTLADGHTSGGQVYVQMSTDGGATWGGISPPMRLTTPSGGTVVVLGNEEGLYQAEVDLTGLQPSTTYLFRIAASYAADFTTNGGRGIPQIEAAGEVAHSPEPNPSITTEPPQAPPTAENLAVTNVTATTAHFSGTVNPNAPAGPLSGPAKKAYETKWHFECTPVCLDANENVIGGTVQGEEGPQTVTGDVKRLEPGTEYTVSLIVSSGIDGVPAVETFPTDKSPPLVKQTSGASDGEGGYTLQGIVNPNNETITACKFKWGPDAPAYAFSADCSPLLPNPGVKPTTVEAHLTGLNPDAIYHSLLEVTYGSGLKEDSGNDQEFKAPLAAKVPCPANEQERAENNSVTLPECRAYEMVTPPGKESFIAEFVTWDGGDRVAYTSEAGNLAKSGQNNPVDNAYVAARSPVGWQTIPNLNGSSGSLRSSPLSVDSGAALTELEAYSSDLRSSVWKLHRQGDPGTGVSGNRYLRGPDGSLDLIGSATAASGLAAPAAVSADLSHVVTWTAPTAQTLGTEWGTGVYEFVGTGMDQPHRVDLDNFGAPISSCLPKGSDGFSLLGNASNLSISTDGSTIVNYVYGGCGGANPPADELWARVNDTTAVDVSASHCNRLDCNGPAKPTFVAATPDGSRVFFATTQQLVDADTDQTNDVYACDIPAGNPAPTPDKANPCAAFREVSGAQTGAAVENFLTSSDNGATVLFIAKGALVDNKDALGEKAVAGDHNLYVWRADASHPDGQTTFVARLDSDDLDLRIDSTLGGGPQATPDGRYLVFTTATQLVATDTDTARDVYRYDADTGELTRASTNVFGVAGNNDAFPAALAAPTEHHPTTTISDDGQKIVFTTTEALSAADGNGEPDVYLWTPSRVSLISTGSSGYPFETRRGRVLPGASVSGSGQDIYFESAQPLTPADGDAAIDVYDARIGGGFSFAPKPVCTGEACQLDATPPPPKKVLLSAQPGSGNPTPPKTCPKGKVRNKKGKCVKKPKRHSGKKHHGKKASHKQGGGK